MRRGKRSHRIHRRNRGMPRVKPPRTVEHGLFDSPTVLNNVETYCNVPHHPEGSRLV